MTFDVARPRRPHSVGKFQESMRAGSDRDYRSRGRELSFARVMAKAQATRSRESNLEEIATAAVRVPPVRFSDWRAEVPALPGVHDVSSAALRQERDGAADFSQEKRLKVAPRLIERPQIANGGSPLRHAVARLTACHDSDSSRIIAASPLWSG